MFEQPDLLKEAYATVLSDPQYLEQIKVRVRLRVRVRVRPLPKPKP